MKFIGSAWKLSPSDLTFLFDEFAGDSLSSFKFGSAMNDAVANADDAIESEIFL